MTRMQLRPLDLFLILVGIILLVYYFPFLLGRSCFYYVDHSMFFEPYCRYLGERIARGTVPLWNPLPGCGQSQLAIASPGLFFPPNWLFAVLPYSVVVALQMVVHQGLAAAAAVLIIKKRLGWGNVAAAVGAAVMALGGYMFALSQNFTIVCTAGWMMAALYAVLSCCRSPSKHYSAHAILASICTCLMLTAGRPEVWGPGLLVLLLVIVYSCASAQQAVQRFLLGLLPVIAGILVAMPSLLPAAQWASLSPRAGGVLRPDPLAASVSWYELIGLIFASPFGSVISLDNPLAPLMMSDAATQVFIPTFFLGPLTITLALVSLWDTKWRMRWLAATGVVILLVVVAGRNTFFLPWLLSLFPVLALVRYPAKLVFFLHLLVAFMAARGASASLRRSRLCLQGWLSATAAWSVFLVLGCVAWFTAGWSWFGFHEFAAHYVDGAADLAVKALAKSSIIWSSVGALTSAAAFWLCKQAARADDTASVGKAAWLYVSLLAVISGLVAWRYTRFATEPGFYNRPSISADMIYRLSGDSAVPPRLVALAAGTPGFGIPSDYNGAGQPLDEAAICQYQRQLCMQDTPIDFGLSFLCPYEGSLTRVPYIISSVLVAPNAARPFPPLEQAVLARVCQMTATKFAISQVVLGDGSRLPLLRGDLFKLRRENGPLNVRLYETIDPLPFAYFVGNALNVHDADSALRLLLQTPEGKLDIHRTVLISPGDDRLKAEVGRAKPKDNKTTGSLPAEEHRPAGTSIAATNLSVSAERITFDVEATSDGYAVAADTYYPGWRATVDGRDTDVLCANAMLKAVRVSRGPHHIEFTFEPQILAVGLLLAFTGILLLAAWILIVVRQGKEQPGDQSAAEEEVDHADRD